MTTLTLPFAPPMLSSTEPEKLPSSGTPPRKLRFFCACLLTCPVYVGRAANTIQVRLKYARRLLAVSQSPGTINPDGVHFVEIEP